MHNEMSYSRAWPRVLGFWSRRAAREGGETPLADSQAVYRTLDPALRRPFEEKGVMYVRNYGVLDLPWQEVFQTRSREEVERYCAQAGIEWEWRGGDRLVTRQVCQAVTTHPETRATVWFNQAHLFHVSSLAPAVRDSLLSLLSVEDLPRNACYGDGSPIPDAVVAEINAAYEEATAAFPWEEGDFLIVDNILLAHGRRPFRGEREVLVAMA
jgi:alpha-ketoglutarate-dependent taurine dioxygenase